MDVLYLSRADVERVCDTLDAVDVVRQVLALHADGLTVLPDEAYLEWNNPAGVRVRSLNMPSFIGGDFQAAGTKIINGNPANPEQGLPRASGLTMLFDETTTQVVCVMEGAYISALRTASVSALAAESE